MCALGGRAGQARDPTSRARPGGPLPRVRDAVAAVQRYLRGDRPRCPPPRQARTGGPGGCPLLRLYLCGRPGLGGTNPTRSAALMIWTVPTRRRRNHGATAARDQQRPHRWPASRRGEHPRARSATTTGLGPDDPSHGRDDRRYAGCFWVWAGRSRCQRSSSVGLLRPLSQQRPPPHHDNGSPNRWRGSSPACRSPDVGRRSSSGPSCRGGRGCHRAGRADAHRRRSSHPSASLDRSLTPQAPPR